MRSVFAAAVVVVHVGGVGPAAAHVASAEGVVPFVDSGAVVGAGTTWGLISSVDGGFAQTCEEAIGPSPPRAFLRVDDDDGGARVLAASEGGVRATVDGGCTWTTVDGTAGHSVTALLRSPERPATLFAVTANLDDGDENGLLQSDDGGASFSFASVVDAGVVLTSAAAGADAAFVAGSDTRVTPSQPVLFSIEDGALVPLDVPVSEQGSQLVRALAVDSDGAWISTLDRIGRGHLWRKTDGAFVEVASFDGVVRATAAVADVRLVVAGSGLVFAAPRDALVFERRTADGPLQCLVAVDGVVYGCGLLPTGAWFKSTADGVTWQPVLAFDEVAEQRCPSTTPAATLCAYRFEEPEPETPAPPEPPTETEQPACASGGAASLVALLGLLQRRRTTTSL